MPPGEAGSQDGRCYNGSGQGTVATQARDLFGRHGPTYCPALMKPVPGRIRYPIPQLLVRVAPATAAATRLSSQRQPRSGWAGLRCSASLPTVGCQNSALALRACRLAAARESATRRLGPYWLARGGAANPRKAVYGLGLCLGRIVLREPRYARLPYWASCAKRWQGPGAGAAQPFGLPWHLQAANQDPRRGRLPSLAPVPLKRDQ